MKTILILGANGMLGNSIFRFLSSNVHCNVIGTVRDLKSYSSQMNNVRNIIELNDVFDKDTLTDLIKKVDYVINCIGIIKQKDSVDYLNCIKVNTYLPHYLASICSDTGSRLIHFSTDCIFDGTKGNYLDDDLPDAKDLYGRSKSLGEVSYGNHLTLRTSIIGHEINSHLSLVDWFLNAKSPINGYSKAIFSGLPTREIARFILEKIILTEKSISGLYNLSASPISKYDLLILINSCYQSNKSINNDVSFVIDRSLNSEKLRAAVNFYPDEWPDLISIMHEDYINLNEYRHVK
ncbi:SDR family oxidoreductase [Limnobaculum zhutongyuii]|uniref:dTDP-4-dehydrorhamnose reductase n=1 Tax=Limnobaculum zhutongyuii TaxID=2498113 RepID=A0A411WP55_9GAMM|nr:SDR family oxidoreductase [Limnobaculum zhutongyuii]QBH97936.1 SDR family oxidoreductase [Limnobaculum zhutongyuii]TQS88205.1 SDR family oxidoreductase [Limnobaculum zhutongyuii]